MSNLINATCLVHDWWEKGRTSVCAKCSATCTDHDWDSTYDRFENEEGESEFYIMYYCRICGIED